MNSPIVKSIQGRLDVIDKATSKVVFDRTRDIMPRLKPFLIALEWSFNGLIWLACTVILIVYNQEQTSMMPKLLIGLVADIFYVAIIKALARRRRPTYANQRDQMIVSNIDKHSFPSGHCSRATYVALFVRHYFSHTSQFFTFLVIIWTFSVCASRVLLGRHHILDCVAGAALGYFNFMAQFHSFLPINAIGMLLIRAMFGSKAFSDPNDMDTDAFE